jgi:predicted enzyme related to lactoylglutathione lyase
MNVLINIDVSDLNEGIGFYTRAFGLRVGRRFGAAGVELLGAPVPFFLLVKAPGSRPHPGAQERRVYRRHWTPVHLDIVVEHLESAIERATQAGATAEAPVRDEAWGRLALLADPFGHGFCLIEFKGRGYDEVATAVG